MTVKELLSKVRDKLQDADGVYWSDSELVDLFNECKRYLSAERQEAPTRTTVALTDGVYEYTVDGVLRYISIKDSNDVVRPIYPDTGEGDNTTNAVIIRDYNKIYVNNPVTGVTLTIKHISFPVEDNLNDDIRIGDEESYRYFIISKAYEKDTDMENFQKAQYFWGMFVGAMNYSKKNSNLNYIDETGTTVSYYY